MKEDFRQALIKTLPILCGYAFWDLHLASCYKRPDSMCFGLC